jgi:hypothetical protein
LNNNEIPAGLVDRGLRRMSANRSGFAVPESTAAPDSPIEADETVAGAFSG